MLRFLSPKIDSILPILWSLHGLFPYEDPGYQMECLVYDNMSATCLSMHYLTTFSKVLVLVIPLLSLPNLTTGPGQLCFWKLFVFHVNISPNIRTHTYASLPVVQGISLEASEKSSLANNAFASARRNIWPNLFGEHIVGFLRRILSMASFNDCPFGACRFNLGRTFASNMTALEYEVLLPCWSGREPGAKAASTTS